MKLEIDEMRRLMHGFANSVTIVTLSIELLIYNLKTPKESHSFAQNESLCTNIFIELNKIKSQISDMEASIVKLRSFSLPLTDELE